MPTYRIRNWDHFQHYRNRNPPWIKLHYELLSSSDWVTLDDTSRVLAVACMLVASRNDGVIDGSEAGLVFLQRVAYLHKLPNLKPLIVSGFLVGASRLQADASNSVSSLYVSSEEGGCKGETKKATKTPHGEFMNVLLTKEEFVKLGERFGNTLARRIENLGQYIESKGAKYKSHYATLLQWAAREKGADQPEPPGEFDHLPKIRNEDYWICGCPKASNDVCRSPHHGMTLAESYAYNEAQAAQ